MPHPEIKNDLRFELGIQHLADCEGAPAAVAVIKATYAISRDGLRFAEMQVPVLPSGEPNGKPGESSYRYEPECCYFKPRTDVVLIGAAVPPKGAATQIEVRFSVGNLCKRAYVFGNRWWRRRFTGPFLSSPEPFTSIPLIYERAFGGWDRSDDNADRHTFDSRNPFGTGFQSTFAPGQDQMAVPNIEDPTDLVTSMSSRPRPVGFGFTSPDWQPRAALAGTYDSAWKRTRMPLLPEDFDCGFFNSASEGLVASGYLAGNEPVYLQNCSSQPVVSFSLPGIPSPVCRFRIKGGHDQKSAGQLDTVVVNSIENIVVLTWRSYVSLPRGPEQLLALYIGQGS